MPLPRYNVPTTTHATTRKRVQPRLLGAVIFPARGAPPPLARARRRGFAALPPGASRGPQALSLLAGPHPRSLALGGAASPPFPPAPHAGRRRSHGTAAILGSRASEAGSQRR